MPEIQVQSSRARSAHVALNPKQLGRLGGQATNINILNFIDMKKISLKNLNLSGVEQLSNDQLKGVLGGFNGSGSGSCDTHGSSCGGSCTTSVGTAGTCNSISVNGAVLCACYES